MLRMPAARAEVLRSVFAAVLLAMLLAAAGCGTPRGAADPSSDAPEDGGRRITAFKDASSYEEALRVWQGAEDVNAWIGARFSYDMARAMRLSETQRRGAGSLPIHPPARFFAEPSGVCVDLARFGVETLRAIDPGAQPRYLMIEFAPVSVAGNTLRMHWVTSFRRDGRYYFFADSKRPGHIAGPYDSLQAFVAEYAAYRGRRILAFREADGYERTQRSPAGRRSRAERP